MGRERVTIPLENGTDDGATLDPNFEYINAVDDHDSFQTHIDFSLVNIFFFLHLQNYRFVSINLFLKPLALKLLVIAREISHCKFLSQSSFTLYLVCK